MLSTRLILFVMLLMSLALLSMSDIIIDATQIIAAACDARPKTRAAGTLVVMRQPSLFAIS